MHALLPWLVLVAAEAPSPPDEPLYNKARANMAAILANQPNYVCIQTIHRTESPKANAKFETIDSLRFEVAYVDKRELYGWPGSKKFEERDLIDMVPEGAAIATGAFAGHAQYLFRTSSATVTPQDWVDDNGHRFARYRFQVPVSKSRYVLMRSRDTHDIVGYSGEIWVDPEVARVMRIKFHADEIPSRLAITKTETVIEYGEARIGDKAFWLPSSSMESITAQQGRIDRNITTFSNCRAFSGESTLRFDDGPTDGATPPREVAIIDLPVGVWFEIQFNEPVDSAKVHVGDSVSAVLATDIKYKGRVYFLKGSTVEMRLVRLQRRRDAVALEFATGDVISPTATARLMAIPGPTANPRGSSTGFVQTMGDTNRPGLGTIYVRGSHIALRKGYRSLWMTTAQPPAPKEERH